MTINFFTLLIIIGTIEENDTINTTNIDNRFCKHYHPTTDVIRLEDHSVINGNETSLNSSPSQEPTTSFPSFPPRTYNNNRDADIDNDDDDDNDDLYNYYGLDMDDMDVAETYFPTRVDDMDRGKPIYRQKNNVTPNISLSSLFFWVTVTVTVL